MDNEHAFPLDPITGLPWSAALRSEAARWAATSEVHAVCLQVAGLGVLIDVFGYRAAHSILGQVGRLLSRQIDKRDLLGRHSGNAFLILTQRSYAEIETLVTQIHERVFTLSIETAEGRVPEGKFGVAGMDPVAGPDEAGPAIDALIINAEIALGFPARAQIGGTPKPPEPITRAENGDVPAESLMEAGDAEAVLAATEPEPSMEPEILTDAAAPIVPQAPEPALEPEFPLELEPQPEPVVEMEAEPAVPMEQSVTSPEVPAESTRVALVRCDVSDAGMAATVEIEVRLGDRVSVGKVVGRNAPDRIAYLVGEATGRALTELLPTGFGVVLQDVRHVTQGENQAVWATVMLVSPEGEEKLLGIAPGTDHGHAGPAKAVLNAINRRLSLVLAQTS